MRARWLVWSTLVVAACGEEQTFTDAAPAGDGGSLSGPGIYVTNSTGVITVFALDATGDTAPIRELGGASTGLSLPIGIAVDRLDNLYVANRTGGNVTVYRSHDDGDVAPARTLTAPGMLSPEGLAVDAADGLFVATCPGCGTSAGGISGVFHFPAGAAAPDTTVTGAATELTDPSSITVAASGEVVVGNSFGGTIATFAAAADGDAAPLRSFTPTASNLQAIARGATHLAVTTPGVALELYDLSASGPSGPAGTLATSAILPVEYPGGVFVDTSATPPTVYLVDFGADAVHVITTAGTEPALTVAGVRTIRGAATHLGGPLHVTIAR
jgi:hypothetical protein